MSTAFQVAEFQHEVTEDYIKRALVAVYGAGSYKFSDKFVRVLLSDYKRKAQNLRWLFGDRNYLRLNDSPKEIYEYALATNKTAKLINDELSKIEGVSFTPEQFLKNRCTFNKQVMKINRVLDENKKVYTLKDANSKGRIDKQYRVHVSGKSFDHESAGIVITDEYLLKIEVRGGREFIHRVYPSDEVRVTYVSKLDNVNVTKELSNLSSAPGVLSMDVADILGASAGGLSSCIQPRGSYHSGALVHYRAPFGVILFTHSGSDRLYKTGRRLATVRLTDQGQPYRVPFFKFQKRYGDLDNAQVAAASSLIMQKAEENLGLRAKDFKTIERHIDRFMASYPIAPIQGERSGYLDSEGSGESAWHVHSSGVSRFENEAHTLLNYQDPLTRAGETTAVGNYLNRDTHSRGSAYGPLYEEMHEVICDASKATILTRDAVEVAPGRWVHKDILASLYNKEPVAVPAQVTPTQEVQEVPQEVEDVASTSSDFIMEEF